MDIPPPRRATVGGVLLSPLARRLLRALPRGRFVAIAFVTLATLTALAVITQADLLASMLADGVHGRTDVGAVAGSLVLLAGVFAARAALTWAQQVLGQHAAASTKSAVRRDVLAHTQRLGPGWLSGQHGGGLATTLGRGLDGLDPYFTGYVPQLFLAAVVPVAVLVRLAVADLASAAVIILTLPLIPVFGILVGLQTRKATARQWRALERLGGHFLDLVAGLPTLRAFGRAQAQAAAVRRSAEEHRIATMRTLRVAFISALVLELVATLSVALVAVPVGLRLLSGNVDLHTALVVLLLAPEAYLPLRALGSQFHSSTEGLEVAERAFAVLDTPPSGRSGGAGAGRRLSAPIGSIQLDRVTVRYPDRDEPAVDNVSLTVRAGEHLALVGPSGAGKSTLLGVLLGLVPVTSGRVVITMAGEAVDLADVDPAEWRRHLAWVPQRPHLFARTVADNIALGRPDASEAQIRSAARAAQADGFVESLPEDYRTMLGEHGAGVSAGQRQRIALARAFLRDAPLLLLDEPTAGLDSRNEATILAATRRLMDGRTVVSVAHRPAVVVDADRVVRIEHGRVVGETDLAVPAGAS